MAFKETHREERHLNELVSVLCPTYNHVEYIDACVLSVRKQTYTSWELIVVDDGSNDGTPEIARSHAGQDKRIKVLRSATNHGLKKLDEVYNAGFTVSSGNLVAVLEGDDYWPPDKLEYQVSNHGGALMSYGDCIAHSPKTSLLLPRPPFLGPIDATRFLRYVVLHESHCIPVTQMFLREALLKIGGFRQDGSPGAVDFATLLAISRLSGSILYLNHALGFWRQHATQTTRRLGVELAEYNLSRAILTAEQMRSADTSGWDVDEHAVRHARQRSLDDVYWGAYLQAIRVNNQKEVASAISGIMHHCRTTRRAMALAAFAAVLFGVPVARVLEHR